MCLSQRRLVRHHTTPLGVARYRDWPSRCDGPCSMRLLGIESRRAVSRVSGITQSVCKPSRGRKKCFDAKLLFHLKSSFCLTQVIGILRVEIAGWRAVRQGVLRCSARTLLSTLNSGSLIIAKRLQNRSTTKRALRLEGSQSSSH